MRIGRLSIGLGVAAVLAVVAGTQWSRATTEPGHLPFHVGCTNHNHGPAWHATHGAALNRSQRPAEPDAASRRDLTGRRITEGR